MDFRHLKARGFDVDYSHLVFVFEGHSRVAQIIIEI